jgi:hypothetical protein
MSHSVFTDKFRDSPWVEQNLYASHWNMPNLIAAPGTASLRRVRFTCSFPEGTAVLFVLSILLGVPKAGTQAAHTCGGDQILLGI